MAIAFRLSPLVIILAIIILVIAINKGLRTAIHYAIGISASIISIAVLIALISLNNSEHEADWPYIVVVIAAIVSIVGSGVGVLLGYYFEKRRA